jgi:hypothetical protein
LRSLASSKASRARQREGAGDHRPHVDAAFVDQAHGQRELGMEAEAAQQRQFLGDDHVLRHRHVAAQAQLHHHAARAHGLQPGAQGPLVAAAFEHHVEAALVGG